MSARVYTARVSYGQDDRFDVTRKSGGVLGAIFAPSWSLLNHARDLLSKAKAFRQDGEIGAAEAMEESAWREYEPRYLDEMRRSYRTYRVGWDALLAKKEVTLVCYCVVPERCHRFPLAAKILVKLGATYHGERPQ